MSILYSCVKDSYATFRSYSVNFLAIGATTCRQDIFFSEGPLFHKLLLLFCERISLNKSSLIKTKIKKEWSSQTKRLFALVFVLVYLSLSYGIALLYSFPSNASLYISATYGFFAGVSAPNSTRRA